MLRKGIHPYDWMDSVEKLNEKSLPPKEAFFSKLNGTNASDEDYDHAQKVWKEFEMETFLEYHNLYNKSDVLLLADVFENLRDICLENYGMQPGILQLLVSHGMLP